MDAIEEQSADFAARVAAVEKQSEDLTPKAAALENRAADLRRLLAALVTVGTIFGFALGVSTYVNLKDTQQSAKDVIQGVARSKRW